jgi:hypothetical protein
MDKRAFLKSVVAFAAAPSVGVAPRAAVAADPGLTDWSISVDVLESCSCPVFCQCFFTGKPPAAQGTPHHHAATEKHYCRFNQAYQVNSGHSGSVRLDGVRFWFLGDAGDDFGKDKLEWSVLSFDPRVSGEQRGALLGILRHLRWYRPERWNSYRIGEDAPIEWAADARGARATLGGGTIAELALSTMLGLHDQPVKISNMEYFGYPRNSGFVLMPSTVLAYRGADHPFDFKDKGTNGFLTTLEMSAADFPG